jgi:hypothetical protein
MKDQKEELYRKVYIKSKADLPKEAGFYFIKYKTKNESAWRDNYQALSFEEGDKSDAIWNDCVDYYLQPIPGDQIEQKEVMSAEHYLKGLPIIYGAKDGIAGKELLIKAMEKYAAQSRQPEITDEEIEERSKELNIQNKGIDLGKEIDDMNLELLRIGFVIGAKAMRDNPEQFKIKPQNKK